MGHSRRRVLCAAAKVEVLKTWRLSGGHGCLRFEARGAKGLLGGSCSLATMRVCMRALLRLEVGAVLMGDRMKFEELSLLIDGDAPHTRSRAALYVHQHHGINRLFL